MIPIILDNTKTLTALLSDNTNGIGRINALSAVVTEERNGMFELEMNVFIEDKHFNDIQTGSIIKVKAGELLGNQMFRVYQITKPINGVCTVYAHHISYDLGKAAVLPFTATGVSTALNGLISNLVETYEFSTYTDIQNTTSTFTLTEPKYFRECLGGYSGSMLDVFGGEYEFDNLTIKLLASRGSDNGVSIKYGKNLSDLEQEINIESMYTAVLGYAIVDETTTTGDIQYIVQTSAPKTKIVDFSNEFESGDTVTKAQLNTLAQNYIQANSLNTPNVNLSVSFVSLRDTDQYKNIAPLERVSLCDTVHVQFEKLGVNATAKVIRTEYDVLNERLNAVEIGDARSSLAQSIAETVTEEAVRETTSLLDSAINHATNMITGGLGGYVVIGRNANGEPEEILIMDSPDKATATNVIRMNQNGIGFSNTGYSGTYTTAWTINGGFVADFITSGTINAIDITASTITGSTLKFGTTPNTVTLRTNDNSDGALFEGEGKVEFETNGEFYASNKDANDYEANRIRLKNNSSTSTSSITNFWNNVTSNFITLSGEATQNRTVISNEKVGLENNANNITLNAYSNRYVIILRNFDFAPNTASSVTANDIQLYSNADYNQIYLQNYDLNNTRKNYILLRSGTVNNVNENSMDFYNVSANNAVQRIEFNSNGLRLYSTNSLTFEVYDTQSLPIKIKVGNTTYSGATRDIVVNGVTHKFINGFLVN